VRSQGASRLVFFKIQIAERPSVSGSAVSTWELGQGISSKKPVLFDLRLAGCGQRTLIRIHLRSWWRRLSWWGRRWLTFKSF
jgi:hypothetical protein